MKKLSIMMAAVALVAVGCDPFDDAPGGDPEVIQVVAASRLEDPVLHTGPGDDGFFVLDAVPAANNVIIITTNKLLDGASIQTAPQDFTDANSIGDCRPADGWLTITKDGDPEPLTYDDPAVADEVDDPTTEIDESTLDDFQWYSCYVPSASTNRHGASIEIFRSKVGTPPGLTAGTGPLRTATLEAGVTYEITGDVRDESGTPLSIKVRVVMAP